MSRVSILMTVYNAEKYIDQAINSILKQSFQEWQLIIIDNASNDRSACVIKSFTDPRIATFFLEENIGRTNALNLACRKATCEYIAILDADDLAEPLRLQMQVEFMDQNQTVGLVGAWAKLIDEGGRLTAYYMPPASPAPLNETLSWSMPIVHSTMLVRRSIMVDELNGYSPDLVIGQDWDLCVRVAEKYPVCVLGHVLGAWRRYPSSITGSTLNHFRGRVETLKILERARKLAKSRAAMIQNRRQRAVALLAISYYSLWNKGLSDALKYLWLALCTDASCVVRNQKIRKLFFKNIPHHHRDIG